MHDIRDQVIDFVTEMSTKTYIATCRVVDWLKLVRNKYYDWRKRYGKVNEHNRFIPRDFWMENWEKEDIVYFYNHHPFEGYRRLTFMMMDEDIFAVSPASVYRVPKSRGLVERRIG